MRLKPIPSNTVVHTPTEAEAKELLAILHENGYKWCGGNSLIEDLEWENYEVTTCYYISSYVEYGNMHEYNEDKTKHLTLAEFKKRYCEEEKPQPKFKVGDKVKIINVRNPMMLNEIGIIEEHATKDSPLYKVKWCEDSSTLIEDVYLEPYTEPETKPTEDMETKEKKSGELGNNSENSQLDNDLQHNWDSLDEQAKEYIIGQYQHGFEGMNTLESEKGLMTEDEYEWHKQYWEGWIEAMINTFPESEMKRVNWMCITAWIGGEDIEEECNNPIDTNKIYFRTPTDRDKCIGEINAVIKKYQK